ncbi:hypothetical protein TWF718_002392 [Orbilia javanica]|uniref:Zn(2)-C6 fungal-type domain-containing protein n=1 Tax=Orbilia javanica TaxID=47235 RepID=A0AAN8MNC7_9PEZI
MEIDSEDIVQKEFEDLTLKEITLQGRDVAMDESSPLNRASRGIPPWGGDVQKENIVDERKDKVESIRVPVESTKFPPPPELSTPGISLYPEAPATGTCPDSNNISLRNHSSKASISHDTTLPLPSSDATEGLSSASLACTTLSSSDPNLPSASTMTPTASTIQNQNMEGNDAGTLKRKRKSPSVGAPNHKQKKAKIMPEPKKAPACKSCYHKHIGCDRLAENEPCRACEKRNQPCERNDVRVVKGEKIVVKEEATAGEPSNAYQTTSQEGSIEGGTETPSSIRAVSVAEANGGEGQNLGVPASRRECLLDLTNQDREDANQQIMLHVLGSSVEERPKPRGIKNREIVEAEEEAAKILIRMRGAEVKLLDERTSHSYFDRIEVILTEEVDDPDDKKIALKMLQKLRWQFIWLSRDRTESCVL